MQNYYIAWGVSIILTYLMQFKFVLNVVKDLADRGYKFNLDNMANVTNKINSMNGKYKVLNKIFPFIPVINILYMLKLAMDYSSNRENLINQLRILGALEIMDDLEQEEYEKKETGLNALLAPKKAEMRLNEALRMKISQNGREGEIFYEVCDGKINVIKATGPALKFSKEEQEDLVYNTFKLIFKNLSEKYGYEEYDTEDNSFKNNNYDLEFEKENLQALKKDLLEEPEEKSKVYVKKIK